MLGPVSMRVTDSYHSGRGLLEVRLLGASAAAQWDAVLSEVRAQVPVVNY